MATMLSRYVSRGGFEMGVDSAVDLQKIGEHDGIFECVRDPDQVQRILVDVDALCECGGIVGAEERAVGVGAEAKVSDTHFELSPADNVGDGGCDTGINLCGVIVGGVVLIVEVDQEDAGNERRGGRAASKEECFLMVSKFVRRICSMTVGAKTHIAE